MNGIQEKLTEVSLRQTFTRYPSDLQIIFLGEGYQRFNKQDVLRVYQKQEQLTLQY